MIETLENWRKTEDEDLVSINAFKKVFLDETGQYVLARMLEKLKFLEHCENERDMALNNFAKDLLATVYWNKDEEKADTGRIMNFIKRLRKKKK